MAQLTVLRDAAEMSAAAAERIASLIESVIRSRHVATVSLAGGRTPETLYRLLADAAHPWRGRIDWTRVHLFWSDERNVPPNDPESNFGLANRTLIQHVRMPASNVHRIRGELAAVDAGRKYDAILQERRARIDEPLFDVMLLGVGANAHVASLFPESPLLVPHPIGHDLDALPSPRMGQGASSRTLATGVWVPDLSQWRITLTPAGLLDSDTIVVIAAGREKANAIAAALHAPPDPARYPAQLLRAAGDRVEWIVDQAAADGLSTPL